MMTRSCEAVATVLPLLLASIAKTTSLLSRFWIVEMISTSSPRRTIKLCSMDIALPTVI